MRSTNEWTASSGSKRTGDPGRNGNRYYRCVDRIYKFPIESNCVSAGVNAHALETAVWSGVVKYLKNPTTLRQYAEKWLNEQIKRNYLTETDIKKLESKMMQVEEKEERYTKAYGAGALSLEQFKESMKETSRLKKGHQTKIDELRTSKQKNQTVSQSHVTALCKEVKNVLQSLDLANKQKLLRDLVDKIIVAGRKSVEVWLHLPIKKFSSVKVGLYVEGRHRRAS